MIMILKLEFLIFIFSYLNFIQAQDSKIDDTCDNSLEKVAECVQTEDKNISLYRIFNFSHSAFKHTHFEPFVTFTNVIDDDDIYELKILSNCIKLYSPNHKVDRKFGSDEDYGGNNVTFIGGFIHEIFPELEKHIKTIAGIAAEKANFRPHPEHLGIHCVEILEYEKGGKLNLHVDNESIFTMAIMLTDSTEYEGGDFYIESRFGEPATYEFTVPKYGGYLFDSQADHGVTEMTRGKREVLVMELWPFEDIPYDTYRPRSIDSNPVVPMFMEINPDGSYTPSEVNADDDK